MYQDWSPRRNQSPGSRDPSRRTEQAGAELLEINVDGDDTDARRFYERHGHANCEPGEEQPLLYYYRELKGA